MKSAITLLAACLLLASMAAADSTGCNVCFRGKPAPNCCLSTIFEGFFGTRIAESNVRPGKAGFVGGANFGLMYNLNSQNAIGAAFYLAGDDDAARYGFVPRYRRWLNRDLGLDLGAGILFEGSDNYGIPKFPGLIGEITLAFRELFAASILFELRPYKSKVIGYTYDQLGDPVDPLYSGSTTERALYLNFTGRSYGAFVIPAFLLIAYAADPM